MNYIIKMMSGKKYKISEENYKKLEGRQGLILMPDIQCTINISAIASIYPENKIFEIEDRKNQVIGILHDGSKARKHFGEWVADNGEVPDDKGNYHPVKLDKQYYPEIALDRVATAREWQQIKENSLNYYEALGLTDRKKRLENTGGFKYLTD